MSEPDRMEEIKGWDAIALEADVGTDDTARARAKDRVLPLPVHYRKRRVFAIRRELDFWKDAIEALTSIRRRRVQVIGMIDQLRALLRTLEELRGHCDDDRELLAKAECILTELDESEREIADEGAAILRTRFRPCP